MLRRLKILLFLFVIWMWLDQRTRRQREHTTGIPSRTGELRVGESIVLEENAPIVIAEEAPLVKVEDTPAAMAEAAGLEVVSPAGDTAPAAPAEEMGSSGLGAIPSEAGIFAEGALPESEAAGAGEVEAEAQRDDLTVIEGIGSRITEILQNKGIHTFQQLAETESDWIQEILRENGLTMIDPATWGEQARLAADGDWDGLKGLQEQLNAGRRL